MKRLIELQPAYLLHSRAFRDTSLILDFITQDYGRISAVANGIRRPKAKNKGLLQAFVPLQISLSGRNELKTLSQVELLADAFILKGDFLFAALYINELMVRLVHGQEVEVEIFEEYEKALTGLSDRHFLEPLLRCFELNLLHALGYGIEFSYEASTGEPINEADWYYFQHESGFILLHDTEPLDKSSYFPGRELINIAKQDYSKQHTRVIAKRILRHVLGLHLGDKPLISRQLFSKSYSR